MKKALKLLWIVLILVFLYLPIFTLMVLSFNESKSMFKWTGLSVRWYKEMFSDSQIMAAVWNTFSIAVMAAVISTIVGTLACVGILAMTKKNQGFILALNNIPLLNADIVIGISLMLTFIACGFYLNWGTVLFAHVTFCIPYVVLSVLPKLKQVGVTSYEAALDLGATPVCAFRKVVMPEIMPGVISGFLLAFTMSVDDFIITYFTRGAGINTISTLIYSEVKIGIRPSLFALSTIIFVVALLVLLIVNIRQDRAERNALTDIY